jgi:glyoxylase-like metal-dependent hydrolase (beta-lactamase superfamily II)
MPRRVKSTVSVPNSSLFGCSWRIRDQLVATLQPFILEVSERLARGETLEQAASAAAEKHPGAAGHFDLDTAEASRGFGLKESVLYREDDAINFMSFISRRTSVRLGLELPEELVRPIADLLDRSASGTFSARQLRADLPDDLHPLLDEFLASEILVTDQRQPRYGWDPDAPGITRLQHACLLFRSPRTRVLIDPHISSGFDRVPVHDTVGIGDLRDQVDAILISHGHNDHWWLPTLMMFPREIPIIVPRVPRPTILCDDFADVLRGLGFKNVIPLEWYAPPYRVGDLEIHAFPFYGEQPLLAERPRAPSLRNWGNTYVLRSEHFSAWVLIDSGNDIEGRMASVAEEVRARFGSVDYVFSNFRPFGITHPFYITGSGHYWLSLTPDQMRRFHEMKDDFITLAPPGIAEVCAAAGARYVLPYAHWWAELGQFPDEHEARLSGDLAQELADRGAATKVLSWKIGDQLRVRPGRDPDFAGPVLDGSR